MRGHSDATYVAAIETGLVAKYWYPFSCYYNQRVAAVIEIDLFYKYSSLVFSCICSYGFL